MYVQDAPSDRTSVKTAFSISDCGMLNRDCSRGQQQDEHDSGICPWRGPRWYLCRLLRGLTTNRRRVAGRGTNLAYERGLLESSRVGSGGGSGWLSKAASIRRD